MRKAIGVRDSRGQIYAVYYIEHYETEGVENIIKEENTFSRDEWERGVAKMEWQVDVTKKVGTDYEIIGNETEDVGNGFVYRIYFIKKGAFTRKPANAVVEESISKWELEA